MNEAEKREMEIYLGRNLDETAANLKPFLRRGDHVLDVGCGPGRITLDVARRVNPGKVVGFDYVAHRVDQAKDLAREQQRDNTSFLVGDANEVPFDDNTFDVVYSHTVLHYFWNPEAARREQRRVLKPNGWLIGAGVRDWGLVQRYPKCPNWDALLRARVEFAAAVSKRDKWERRPCLIFTETGRRCPQWFSALGMKDLQVQIEPYKLEYPGAEGMDPSGMDLLPWDGEDRIGYFADYRAEYESIIAAGYLKADTLTLAMEEARQWFRNPAAFHFYAMVFVAGRKPAR